MLFHLIIRMNKKYTNGSEAHLVNVQICYNL